MSLDETGGAMGELSTNEDIRFVTTAEPSEWKCYLFGNTPDGNGIVYHPDKHDVPNMFIRFFMKVCLGCTWIKSESKR